jgi:hypothetical protein
MLQLQMDVDAGPNRVEEDEALATAHRILSETPLIGKLYIFTTLHHHHFDDSIIHTCIKSLTHCDADGHNDFPYIVRGWHPQDMNNHDITNLPAAHTDLARLRQGRVGCQIWSAYVPRLALSPPSRRC